jgi:hypothetical protein
MELTRNFTLSELTKSDTAIRKGINNNPNAEQVEKLKLLCENILQPVRDHFGIILEFYTPGEPNSGWIHCSYIEGTPRASYLHAFRSEGKTKYKPIIGNAKDIFI